MSGGYFEYRQFQIQEIIDAIEEYLSGRELDDYEVDEARDRFLRYGIEDDGYEADNRRTRPNRNNYGKKTLSRMRNAVRALERAQIYAHRIDYLLSGDDDEDEFGKRLEEEIGELDKAKLTPRTISN